MADSTPLHFIVIGAGPQGLATALELLLAGYRVTVLETNDKTGQGISYRTEGLNDFAMVHTSATFPADTWRTRACVAVYKALKNLKTLAGAMALFAAHTTLTGKLVIARTKEEADSLRQLAEPLTQRGIAYQWVEREAVDSLNEPALATSANTELVLNLTEARILNLRTYIPALKQAVIDAGGEIKFGHQVTGFVPPHVATQAGTGVICKIAEGEKTIYANGVINRAGLFTATIAEKANEALRASLKGKSPQEADISLPEIPQPAFTRMAVLAPKELDESMIDSLSVGRMAYFVGSMTFNGLEATVGEHVYTSLFIKANGRYWPSIGPLVQGGISLEEAQKKELGDFKVTDKMWAGIRRVMPDIKQEDWESKWKLVYVGTGSRALDARGVRDFSAYTTSDGKDYYVRSYETGGTPGAATNAILAQQAAEEISADFHAKMVRARSFPRSTPQAGSSGQTPPVAPS